MAGVFASSNGNISALSFRFNSDPVDTTKLHYPLFYNKYSPYSKTRNHSLDLKTPSIIKRQTELDSTLKNYKTTTTLGGQKIGEDEYTPFDEYINQNTKEWMTDYFKKRSQAQTNVQGSAVDIGKKILDNSPLGNLLNNGVVDIKPQGSAELIFSYDYTHVGNPLWTKKQQNDGQFKFDQKIQANVLGNIGDKFKVNFNYDTESQFDFDQQKQFKYEGKDHEIVKSFEIGDVSLPNPGTLIPGSSSLFGVKSQLQFGKFFVTGVYSTQKTKKTSINVEGGAQKQYFDVQAENYDANRHYLLAQYFVDHYDAFNRNYPAISNVQITRMEVWVTNKNNTVQNTRNIVGFMDLGESNPYNKKYCDTIANGNPLPSNKANGLYSKLSKNARFRDSKTVGGELTNAASQGLTGQDYVKLDNARLLNSSEYSFNPKLGFISLNQQLNPKDILAVSYEYTVNGIAYQVGEFSRDIPVDPDKPNVLFVKLLKNESVKTNLPIWDLMMKNVYSLNAYQMSSTDFHLQVIYADKKSGNDLTFIPEKSEPGVYGSQLINLLGLDRFNSQQENKPDGNFDFVEGLTVNANYGRIIFPVLQPFGNDLRKKFVVNPDIANDYVFDSLYKSTKFIAQQQDQANKFYIKGSYQGSSGSVIPLNAFNVQPGMVKVSANGAPLTENYDYTVDYYGGTVTIINTGLLASGAKITVDVESQNVFSFQQKTLMGERMEYRFNKNFYVGSTLLYLRERPINQKENIGEESIRNTIYGFDTKYYSELPWLTKLVDKLPFLETKEKSDISATAEWAKLDPGHPRLINDGDEKGGVSYLDDFEAAEIGYSLSQAGDWHLGSIPQFQPRKFPEANKVNQLVSNYNRAQISWYNIDAGVFYRKSSLTPPDIEKSLNSMYSREVTYNEVFPNKQLAYGTVNTLQTFDITYYPFLRGPNNYNAHDLVKDATSGSKFVNPVNKWGGIMRQLDINDFEQSNIEYVEFWMMDPSIDKKGQAGSLYIDLGNVSEDVLHDGRKSWENGLPKSANITDVDTTVFGRIPNKQQITTSFDNDPTSLKFQDVGLDGLSDADENLFFKAFVDSCKAKGIDVSGDPSADDYSFFRSPDYDNSKASILERYLKYKSTEANSQPTSATNLNAGSQYPDNEDINEDFTLNELEEYFEYKVDFDPAKLVVGQNYIADKQVSKVRLQSGQLKDVTWYQFKIPITEYTSRFGQIQDFKSISFMRMYFHGFADTVTCRFAELQLVRGDWRKYQFSLLNPTEHIPIDVSDNTLFDVSSVGLEANGKRKPIPYVIPPGVRRQLTNDPYQTAQDEKSLSLKICNLKDGDARAVYKTTTADIRKYGTLKLYAHAEGTDVRDLALIVRLGTDFNSNYYEYEVPLKVSAPATTKDEEIWKNDIILSLANFTRAKLSRDSLGLNLGVPYTRALGNGVFIRVVGNPDLGNLKNMMIGLKNPKNDGLPSCGEVWVNELRVTDFAENSGWAATANIKTKLADFGEINLSGNRKTIGWGGLEQTLQERSKYDFRSYDLMSSFRLGKFFPAKMNVNLPLYMGIGEEFNQPEYNPLKPDLSFKQLKSLYTGKAKDSVIRTNAEYTKHKDLNFTNVSIGKIGKGKHTYLWDPSNFTSTFSYRQVYKTSIDKLYDNLENTRAGFTYNYAFKNNPIQPFKKLSKSKLLIWLTDFNFNYLPSNISFATEGNRKYNEILYRNAGLSEAFSHPYFDKDFILTRKYALQYALAKSLKLSYNADASSRVEEPFGKIDTKEEKDTIIQNIKKLGRLTKFDQQFSITYDVPISKLPMMDWTTLQTTYNGSYNWTTAPPANDSLGNTIENAGKYQANLQLNFTTLYNKFKIIKKLTEVKKETSQSTMMEETETDKTDTSAVKPKKKDQSLLGRQAVASVVRLITCVKSFSTSYSLNQGLKINGYTPTPNNFGQTWASMSPGLPFILGQQEKNYQEFTFSDHAAESGWITKDTNLSSSNTSLNNKAISGQASLEPFKNFKINVDFTQTQSQSSEELFKFSESGDSFNHFGFRMGGSYSTSILPIKTAFVHSKDPKATSPLFQQMEDYRLKFSKQLNSQNSKVKHKIDSSGYYNGYSEKNQDVLLYSFLAAYMGKDADKMIAGGLSPFFKLPAPNWRVNYSLNSIKAIEKTVKSINFSHGYHSSYNISNYKTALNYDRINGMPISDTGRDVPSYYQFDQVGFNEQFSPLAGVDITWANNLTSKISYSKDRTNSLTFSNNQLTESRTSDFTVGIGYKKKNMILPGFIRDQQGKKVYLKNDVDFRVDFSLKNNITNIQTLGSTHKDPTNGQKALSLKPTAEYSISKSLNLKIFFTHTFNRPYTTNQYPTNFTNGGFSLRYTLAP